MARKDIITIIKQTNPTITILSKRGQTKDVVTDDSLCVRGTIVVSYRDQVQLSVQV